ncbi:MAG: hypothetical protein IPP52_04765 [Ignavibacteria bacterium]|nr:hypothetical protein [Ignavibacteria bacterium]
MNLKYKKLKNKPIDVKKNKSTNQSLLLDKDVLNAVQIMDTMRDKYISDKNWNSVDVIRKFSINK